MGGYLLSPDYLSPPDTKMGWERDTLLSEFKGRPRFTHLIHRSGMPHITERGRRPSSPRWDVAPYKWITWYMQLFKFLHISPLNTYVSFIPIPFLPFRSSLRCFTYDSPRHTTYPFPGVNRNTDLFLYQVIHLVTGILCCSVTVFCSSYEETYFRSPFKKVTQKDSSYEALHYSV